ncbi:hypothetical protein LCL89_14450 [Halobacillus yeomjeoni]|uniref:hypothetical protein n=1 Tax=Halobacillus yeomjeoni TaxID=311194 RepID=UPI001CD4CD0A|nr:hypothetical protein [Halobacillus yeomjeoni]MCA0985230.1 hypothetical protein [Halobacillus yeomjeoni]
MKIALVCPLTGPLKKYELIIDEIVREMGFGGKIEEFKQEGRKIVYREEDELYSMSTEEMKDAYMDRSIRDHYRNLFSHQSTNQS